MKIFIKTFLVLCCGMVFIIYTNSCKKVNIITTTTTDVNIYSYLKQHPDSFSMVTALADKAGYSAFLNAYGTYTFFVPTNSAINKYLQSVNQNIDQLQPADAQTILKLHLIIDTLNTNTFTDGKLRLPTMLGQYLITGVNFKDGISLYSVNRQANIIMPNIDCANGIIHGIDNVLRPATLTVAKMVEQDGRYGIMTQALKETGYYDSLNIVNNPDTTRR